MRFRLPEPVVIWAELWRLLDEDALTDAYVQAGFDREDVESGDPERFAPLAEAIGAAQPTLEKLDAALAEDCPCAGEDDCDRCAEVVEDFGGSLARLALVAGIAGFRLALVARSATLAEHRTMTAPFHRGADHVVAMLTEDGWSPATPALAAIYPEADELLAEVDQLLRSAAGVGLEWVPRLARDEANLPLVAEDWIGAARGHVITGLVAGGQVAALSEPVPHGA